MFRAFLEGANACPSSPSNYKRPGLFQQSLSGCRCASSAKYRKKNGGSTCSPDDAEMSPWLSPTLYFVWGLVEGGGFEPPKASPTDLQSVPFDRSGTPPWIPRPTQVGASEGTRTPDQLITNQPLYQLSYAGPDDMRKNKIVSRLDDLLMTKPRPYVC